MADYYTKFSFTVPFHVDGNTEEEDKVHVRQLTDELNRLIDEAIEDPEHEVFPEEDALMYGLHVAASGSGVWITDDAGEGSVDGAIAAGQWLLQQPGVATDKIEFGWSNDCSKPQTDAYGGGVAEVIAGSVKTWGSWQGLPKGPPQALIDEAASYLARYEAWREADDPEEDEEIDLRVDAAAIIAAFVERGMSELP